MNIPGQSAIVTGGGSGLGDAVARALAEAGAKVAVLDVNAAGAQRVAAEIGGIACTCDVTHTESVTAALDAATAAHGVPRIVMNIATTAPGIFATPLLQQLPEPVQQSLAASIPFPKRLGEPSELASMALEIVRNGHLNGEVIRLDGALRTAPR